MIKVLFLTLFFYILALFQTTFLVHLSIKGITPNLILILVILVNYFIPQQVFTKSFSKTQRRLGIFASFVGGFFLDIFSNHPFTISLLVLLCLSFLIRVTLKGLNKYNIFLFTVMFISCILFYDLFLNLLDSFWKMKRVGFISFQWELGQLILVKIIYNLFFGILGYFLFVRFPWAKLPLRFFSVKKRRV